MKKISLIHLKAGHKGKVIDITGGSNLAARLMSMGLYKGKELIKLSHIGLRGPVVIKSGRTILALGHGPAAKIILEVTC
ncbi:MAG: FeoA domain-containing protein [Candidatus Omnitrophota bacterium]|nr:FeoA domain-containing protein [Candidatus Omnitrophota bacterium]